MSVGAPDANLGSQERLDEVARLLALGYLRMRERQRKTHPNPLSKLGLDFSGHQRMCVENNDAHGESKR